MSQRRAASICYNCYEKFVYGYRCNQLFILEIILDHEDEVDTAALAICATYDVELSLNAFTGIHPSSHSTMKILGIHRPPTTDNIA
ncbi:hypothetical protein U9M48_036040 [Paspalum notatum var. saurae]|uniref:Uncharacterized protein n=1 Tax=Paspalum notatum var. saurae TaxID=547442 RepID=A0AAQ3XAM8_PASNO